MDPCYQKPPHYSQIRHHQPVSQPPIEINEIGPTIQQGVIQCPVQRGTQATGARPRRSTPPMNTQQTVSVPNSRITEDGGTLDSERDKLLKQGSDPNHND